MKTHWLPFILKRLILGLLATAPLAHAGMVAKPFNDDSGYSSCKHSSARKKGLRADLQRELNALLTDYADEEIKKLEGTIKRFDLCKKGRLENTHLAIEVQLLDGDGMRTSTFSAFAQASNTRKGMAEKQVVKAAVAEIAKRVKKALDRSMNLQSAINQSDYNLELRRKPASER